MVSSFKIFPAIDIQNGECVRLEQGKFHRQKVYSSNPVDVALSFENQGFTTLHLVDLDGAKKGQIMNWDIIQNIVRQTKLQVDVGGGIKSLSDIIKLFNMGVRQVNLGSIAFKKPDEVKGWLNAFGNKIILSADVLNYEVAVAGWQENTGIQLNTYLQPFIDSGLETVTCTDISRDGMLAGPGLDLYKSVITHFPYLNVIASGGIRSISDIQNVKTIGCIGCIVGKALYEGTLNPTDIPKVYL